MDVHAAAKGHLAEIGQRYTPGRRRLVEILSGSRMPLSIPEVLRGRRQIAQSSAYRNLSALERAGVVRRVVTGEDFARYELAEELTEHHHHLVCSSCGRVEDVAVPPSLERTLGQALDRIGGDVGFAAVSHRLDLIGTCRTCARA